MTIYEDVIAILGDPSLITEESELLAYFVSGLLLVLVFESLFLILARLFKR